MPAWSSRKCQAAVLPRSSTLATHTASMLKEQRSKMAARNNPAPAARRARSGARFRFRRQSRTTEHPVLSVAADGTLDFVLPDDHYPEAKPGFPRERIPLVEDSRPTSPFSSRAPSPVTVRPRAVDSPASPTSPRSPRLLGNHAWKDEDEVENQAPWQIQTSAADSVSIESYIVPTQEELRTMDEMDAISRHAIERDRTMNTGSLLQVSLGDFQSEISGGASQDIDVMQIPSFDESGLWTQRSVDASIYAHGQDEASKLRFLLQQATATDDLQIASKGSQQEHLAAMENDELLDASVAEYPEDPVEDLNQATDLLHTVSTAKASLGKPSSSGLVSMVESIDEDQVDEAAMTDTMGDQIGDEAAEDGLTDGAFELAIEG